MTAHRRRFCDPGRLHLHRLMAGAAKNVSCHALRREGSAAEHTGPEILHPYGRGSGAKGDRQYMFHTRSLLSPWVVYIVMRRSRKRQTQNPKGVIQMKEKEQDLIEALQQLVPKLNELEKARLTGFAEGMAYMVAKEDDHETA